MIERTLVRVGVEHKINDIISGPTSSEGSDITQVIAADMSSVISRFTVRY